MAKIATDWNHNPALYTDQYTYNSSTIMYNDGVHTYSGVPVPIPDYLGKVASEWNADLKTAVDWDYNPGFFVDEWLYDSASTYDSTRTYDGVVAGESSISTKTPTEWNL